MRDSEKNLLINAAALAGGLTAAWFSLSFHLRIASASNPAPKTLEASHRVRFVSMPTNPASEFTGMLRSETIANNSHNEVFGADPIKLTLLDCSKEEIIAYPDPAGANKRLLPSEQPESTILGKINAGTEITVKSILEEIHVEGSKRFWSITKDEHKVPSYVLTMPANSLVPGALNTNGDLNSCERVNSSTK